ncbi:MAG TPA: hypothetical protein VN969_06810 [Streptosporangiaceae bacterium]|nr:hypothetical protein [Streptosporangiaceae bacterium]
MIFITVTRIQPFPPCHAVTRLGISRPAGTRMIMMLYGGWA